MKLWTTIELTRLPAILETGFDNPYSDEVIFYSIPDIAAEQAVSMEGELAFIETEIPDERVDEFFAPCLGSYGDEAVNQEIYLQDLLAEGDEKGAAELREHLTAMEGVDTGRGGLEVFGYACLAEIIPPSMLKLLDPMTMLEAVQTGDTGVVSDAINNSEATAFKSLGANFWVWLMLLLGQIMGPGYGIPQGTPEEELEEEARKAIEKARTIKPKKKRKRAKPRAKKASP